MVRLRGHERYVPLVAVGAARAEIIAALAMDDERIGHAYHVSPSALRAREGMRELRRVLYMLEHDDQLKDEFKDLISASSFLQARPYIRVGAARRAFLQAFQEYREALVDTNGAVVVAGDIGVLQYCIRELERLGDPKEPTVEVRLTMKPDDARQLRRLASANGLSPGELAVQLMQLREVVLHNREEEDLLKDLQLNRTPPPEGVAGQMLDATQLPGGAT